MHALRKTSLALLIALSPASARAAPPVTVGVVLDGQWARDGQAVGLFEKEVRAVLSGTREVTFPADKRRVGSWDAASVKAALEALVADPEVDVVLALGLIASNEAARIEAPNKPLIAPLVVDPRVQGVPFDADTGTSGRKNFTFVTTPDAFKKDLLMLRELTAARKVAFLTTEGFSAAIPPLEPNANKRAAELGIELFPVPVAESAKAVLDALPADVDAVYVGGLQRLSDAELDVLAKGFIERKLPSFAMVGRAGAERGLFAAIEVGFDIARRARRAALDVERAVLGGEDPGTMKVALARRERLVINMTTARAIGVWPSFAVLTEADLIEVERATDGEGLDLRRAAQIAVAKNLDLLANAKEVSAGAEEIRKARASILPQVELSATGLMIDSDRANPLSNQAERQLSASGVLRQTLYSENAYANLTIQKYIQKSRVFQRDRLVLDVIRDTSVAYLDVLRAQTFERIQRDNLAVTRANLELAEVRRTIGVAGPSEVYRWQSQLANDRASVISASANRNAAEINLNRLMNRPLEAQVMLTETKYEDPLEVLGGRPLFAALGNPWSFKIFRRFMVAEGIQAAPELRAVDAVIAAAQRRITAAGRAWWLPTFGLQAQLDQIIAQGGEGAETDPNSPLAGFATPNDTSWSVAVNAQFPLFAGLARDAEQDQADRELEQTKLERDALAQRVEQRIRTALHLAGASFANIRLSRDASEAANKNLEVVQDAYARGALSYLNLLDAQNAALTAREVAANAVYDFLVDFTEVQRAASRFDLLATPEDRAEWKRRLDDFLKAEGHPAAGEAPKR